MRQSAARDELVAAAVKYVRKRGSVYQYERRVPERVKRQPSLYALHFGSRPLFRRSLRTSEQGEMHAACIAVHLEFERKIAPKSEPSASTFKVGRGDPTRAPRKVTQVDLDQLAGRYKRITIAPIERAHIRADSTKGDAEEYERMIYELELEAEDKGRALATRGSGDGKFETPAEIAEWVVANEGWDAPLGSSERGAVIGAIRAGIQQGRDYIDKLVAGATVPRLAQEEQGASTKVPCISEACDRYLAQKRLPPRTEGEVRSSLRLFVDRIGDKTLDEVSRRDFQSFAEHLAGQVIGGKTAGSIVRPASRATVRKRIGLLRAVINHAIAKDEFSGPNPAAGINVDTYVARPNRALMPKKRRFSVDEMNAIFRHPWFTGCASASQTHLRGTHRLNGSEYWVPVLAALTGCRASELGGLMLSEVRLDDARPHLVIRDNMYRRTKGGYSRNVPVLDCLLALGFAAYIQRIEATGADRVFPDWKPPKGRDSERNDDKAWSNGKVIRAFNRTVIPGTLGDRLAQGARQEVTFHSFRGAFKAMLGNSEFKLHPNVINEVVGHAKPDMDAVYVGEVPIEETYPAIRACNYDGLIIPRYS